MNGGGDRRGWFPFPGNFPNPQGPVLPNARRAGQIRPRLHCRRWRSPRYAADRCEPLLPNPEACREDRIRWRDTAFRPARPEVGRRFPRVRRPMGFPSVAPPAGAPRRMRTRGSRPEERAPEEAAPRARRAGRRDDGGSGQGVGGDGRPTGGGPRRERTLGVDRIASRPPGRASNPEDGAGVSSPCGVRDRVVPAPGRSAAEILCPRRTSGRGPTAVGRGAPEGRPEDGSGPRRPLARRSRGRPAPPNSVRFGATPRAGRGRRRPPCSLSRRHAS